MLFLKNTRKIFNKFVLTIVLILLLVITLNINQVAAGVCGSANGQSFSASPVNNLCSSGTPSAVGTLNSTNGVGAWTWYCDYNTVNQDNCAAGLVTQPTCSDGWSNTKILYTVGTELPITDEVSNYTQNIGSCTSGAGGTSPSTTGNTMACVTSLTCAGGQPCGNLSTPPKLPLEVRGRTKCTAPTNTPPNPPSLSGNIYIALNTPTTNWVTATDPDGDALYYQLDWDGNGTVDGTTGTFASGASVVIGHTYTAVGAYNVRARAVDPSGLVSAWSTIHTINVFQDGSCGTSTGTISNTPPSTNLCQNGTPTIVTTGASTYTWTCTGSGGGATSPSCSAPRNTAPGAPTISGTNTGTTGVTKNNTVSATDPQAQSLYYQLDWDGNGTVDGTTGTFPSGASVAIGNIYNTAGTYNARARAVDTMGLISPWSAIFSITITTPVVGTCGTANGLAVASAPTSNLCQSGTPTAVSGTGPFTWTCNAPGGNSPTCSAPIFNCEAGVLNPSLNIASSNSLIGAALNGGVRWFHSIFSNGSASCFRNTSSNNYFVPTATQMERDAFMNNLPDGVTKGGF